MGRRAPILVHEKCVVHTHDLTTVPQLPSVDVAFCCLGTTIKKAGSREAFREVDVVMVQRFAEGAKQAGATSFVLVSAVGANARSAVFYNRVKGEIEAAIVRMGFDAVGIVRPSFLVGERNENRLGERLGILAFSVMSPLMHGPMKRYRPVLARDVAAAMLAFAMAGQHGVKVVESDAITMNC